MRGIEVIILQSRGKPLLSQSTPDKELSVTPNDRYSAIRALLKSRALTSTLKPHLSKLWSKKHDAFLSASSGSCPAQKNTRNWPTRTHCWHVPPLCPLLMLREHFSCHLEAPGMKTETALQFRDRESLVSLQKKT